MIVGVPKETYPGDRRVALVPLVVGSLAKANISIVVESGAGIAATYADFLNGSGRLIPILRSGDR